MPKPIHNSFFPARMQNTNQQTNQQTDQQLTTRNYISEGQTAAGQTAEGQNIALRVSSERDTTIVVTDYSDDNFKKFITLFSSDVQQAVSGENTKILQKQLNKEILTFILNSKDKLQQISQQSESYKLKDSVKNLVRALEEDDEENALITIYYHIENNLELKKIMNDMMGEHFSTSKDITERKFKGLLYTFVCKYDTKYLFTKFFAVVSSVYKKAETCQKLVSFMKLSQNLLSNAFATDTCKIQLLLEVLSLIEHNCDCMQDIEKLTKMFNESPEDMRDGEASPKDDRELAQVFHKNKLTAAQHDITPIIQPLVAQPKKRTATEMNSKEKTKTLQPNVSMPLTTVTTPMNQAASATPITQPASITMLSQEWRNKFSDPLSLLPLKCQQATSTENCKAIKKDLDNKVINRLLYQIPQLQKLSNDSTEAKHLLERITNKSFEELKSELTSVDPTFKFLFRDEFEGVLLPIQDAYTSGAACITSDISKKTNIDAEFSSNLFIFHCCKGKEKTIISAISLYLYKQVDEQHAPVIIDFLKLAINVMQYHATSDCIIKQLIEVASLIENNVKCEKYIKQLTEDVAAYIDLSVDGPVYERDNQNLIALFQEYKLTAEQWGIKPKIYLNSQSKPIQETQATPSTSKSSVVQPEEELNTPDEVHNLHIDIQDAMANEKFQQELADDLQDVILRFLSRNNTENSSLFIDEDGEYKHPPEEVYDKTRPCSKYSCKPEEAKTDKLRNELDIKISYDNEADFFSALLIYNHNNRNSKLHQKVSILTLEIFYGLNNMDIKPLIDLLVVATKLENTLITPQDKLNMLVKVAVCIENKIDYLEALEDISSKIKTYSGVSNSDRNNTVTQASRQADQEKTVPFAYYNKQNTAVAQPTD